MAVEAEIVKQKTKAEIVQETIDHIRTHGLCLIEGRCVYSDFSGNMCAVGRCMSPEYLKKYGNSNKDAVSLIEENGQELFFAEYRGHDSRFWTDLQSFHDSFSVWDGRELTTWGKMLATELAAETTETTQTTEGTA